MHSRFIDLFCTASNCASKFDPRILQYRVLSRTSWRAHFDQHIVFTWMHQDSHYVLHWAVHRQPQSQSIVFGFENLIQHCKHSIDQILRCPNNCTIFFNVYYFILLLFWCSTKILYIYKNILQIMTNHSMVIKKCREVWPLSWALIGWHVP